MKIRSITELENALDNDIAWRKREFTTLKFMTESARNHEKKILMKASLVLLYSHWEGHVKFCAQAYISYLNSISPSYKDMTDNFLQISLGEKFKQGFSIKKLASQQAVFKFLMNESDSKFQVNEKVIIDTESNLKYEVVHTILCQLGLDTKTFELKQNFINSKLLKFRNQVAHGEQASDQDVKDTYDEIESNLLSMIVTFQNLVRNAADSRSYLKQAS